MTGGRIVVFGGSGFLGSRLVAALAQQGYAVVVPTRKREHARHLLVLPSVDVVECDVSDPAAFVELLREAMAVYFLIGILHERRPGDFGRVHVDLLKRVLAAAAHAGVGRFLHVSALHADAAGPSEYLRSKAAGESALRQTSLAWTIFQPSVVFGPGDSFLSLFAALMRWTPVLPLASPDARFQPLFVGDLVSCLVRALGDRRTIGQAFALCGPRVYTLREIVAYVAQLQGLRRWIFGLGPSLSAIQAAVFELLPGPLLTRDNLRSMQKDSVCACAFPELFGLAPASLESIAPDYIGPGAVGDRYLGTREKRLG